MTTKLYVIIIGIVSSSFALCVALLASLKMLSDQQPQRPVKMPATAVWRPTPSEDVALFLSPHGDWVSCQNLGTHEHCLLTDAAGRLEYESDFSQIPEDRPLVNAQLLPITSDTISPWMWSNHANRQVPIIQLEDGTVLVPSESAGDLRAYVKRVQKVSGDPNQVPAYLKHYPAIYSSSNQE